MKKGVLLESLETILVVTVITMLIWLYAEGETIRTDDRTIQVRFVAQTGLAITVSGQEPGTTTLRIPATLQTSQGDWERIAEWVRDEIIEIEVNAPAPETAESEQTLNLLDALNNSPLADKRAFVKEVSPRSVTVRVQKLVTVEMGLRVDPGEIKLTADEPTFSHENVPLDKIQVELPVTDAKMAEDLKLIARLDNIDPNTLKEDTHNVRTVELSLPPELQNRPHITLARNSVEVSFLVDKLTEEYELPRVQVRLTISDDITGQYRIQIDPDTQKFIKVMLKGPEQAINRIKEQPDLVSASITLKLSDLQNDAPHDAPLDIDVPEGVTVVSPEPTQTVSYTVTELAPQP